MSEQPLEPIDFDNLTQVPNMFDEQRRALAIQVAQGLSNTVAQLLGNAKAIENYLEYGSDYSDSIADNPNGVDLPL